MDKQWKVCIQINPKYDGEYYVYIFNAQTGDELRTLFYKNNNWQGLTDDETVIAWKEKDLKKLLKSYNYKNYKNKDKKKKIKIKKNLNNCKNKNLQG